MTVAQAVLVGVLVGRIIGLLVMDWLSILLGLELVERSRRACRDDQEAPSLGAPDPPAGG